MMKVALRAYNREIEILIDQGHSEEAVAHCMHILKIFPKHLETYRLMGKAYLEAHRYAEAADIFQRVLLAVPDDFVSHLGMSIANDERRDLSGAIWHMERAFEVNSTNGGIQSELRHLYGRRDGLEPARIHLTRGALAQIYMKGEEYQQAITEIKAVLAEGETRNDMKTLLARAYFRAGMKNEAVETCIDLLKLYPYSLDGNRILVEILPGTSMAQGVEQYQRRIRSLDPYAAAATGSIFDTLTVPDEAVTIERLDWAPGQNPQWAASAQHAAEIPTWMRQSGWGPTSGAPQPETTQPEQPARPAPAAGELAAAEIPDWLKAMAPPAAVVDSASQVSDAEQADEALEGADFEWLTSLDAPVSQPTAPDPETLPIELPATPAYDAEPSAAVVPAAAPPKSTEAGTDDGSLDWLNNLVPATDGAVYVADAGLGWLNNLTPAAEDKPATEQPAPDLPDWLSDLGKPEAPAHSAESIPDWLKDLAIETPAAAPAAVESTPDWPKGLAAEQIAEPPATEISAISETPVAALAQESTSDWLKDLAAEPPVAEIPAVTETPAAAPAPESTSDWLKDLAAEPPAAEIPAISETPVATPAPKSASDWLDEFLVTPIEPLTQPGPVDDWLDSHDQQPFHLEAGTPGEPAQTQPQNWWENPTETPEAQAEEPSSSALGRLGTVPEFSAPVEETPSQPASQPAAGNTTELPENLPSAQNPSDVEQEEAFEWLENLIGGQGAKSEELITPPAEPSETAPTWVTEQPAEEPAAEAPAAQEAAEEPANEVPVVTENLAAETPLSALASGPGTSASEQDDALAWLEALAQEKSTEPEELITPPTEPSEIAPAWVTEQPAEEPAAEAFAAQEAAEAPAAEVPVITETPAAETPLSALASGPGTSASEQDDTLAWLESQSQGKGTEPEELITPPAEPSETAPAWVTEQLTAEAPAAEAPDTEVPVITETPADETPLSALASGPGTSASEQDDTLAWLESQSQEKSTEPEELITPPAEPSETAPAWVTEQPTEEPTAEAPGAEIPAATEPGIESITEVPAQLTDTRPTRVVQTAEIQPVPAFESQPAQEEPLVWLQGLTPEEALPKEITPQLELKDLGTASAGFADAIAADNELDWLGDLSKPEEPAASKPSELVETRLPEAQPTAPALPDAPDVCLDWLTGPSLAATPKTVQPLAAEQIAAEPIAAEAPTGELTPAAPGITQTIQPAEIQDNLEETSDRFTYLGETNGSKTIVLMPWEQEAPPAASVPTPIPSKTDDAVAWLANLELEGPKSVTALTVEATPVSAGPAEPAEPTEPGIPAAPTAVEPAPAPSKTDEASAWLASLELEEPKSVTPLTWEPTSVSISPAATEAQTEETKPAERMPWEMETTPENASTQSQASSDISEWLKNLDEPEEEHAAPERTPSWVTPISAPAQTEDSKPEELPDWLKDPAVDEQTSAPLPAKTQEPDPEVQPEELENPAPSEPATVSAPEPVQVVKPERTDSGLPDSAPLVSDKDTLAVQRARDLLTNAGLEGAMNEYSKLIKKGKVLEEVIYDLQEAVYSHPVDVIVWQTLGDAYFRSNRLQEALDAYGKAEGLLR